MAMMNPSQQKLAEKLIILNDRSTGMLTRIYNIKKACGDPKSKPPLLSEKSLENAIKLITKKFPTIDMKSGGGSLQVIGSLKNDLIKSLSLYYYTFVDLLDLKDHICELLTTMDACQVHLDITLNYDLCSLYLNLVVSYISLMVLLSRVDDRKSVLGLYNAAHDVLQGQSESHFPRLGQMIVDYENAIKKLSEEFIPHSRLLLTALSSLASVYLRRNLTADQWRSAQMLSLVAAPQQMLYAAQTDTIPCEYLSLDTMDRWIIFGLLVCHSAISQPVLSELWQKALERGLSIRLFRDEIVILHPFIVQYFETLKNYGKRINEVKEYQQQAINFSGLVHRERRKFLRAALKEMCTVLTDQPGLLGPKVLFVFMGLSFARDEVTWLLRHTDCWPIKQGKTARNWEDIRDRQLPELLFHMEELRGLVRKYSQVIQRYYLQYLSGYDAISLNGNMQSLPNIPEDESIILSSFCNKIGELNLDQLDKGATFDFRGLRLDWCRLQAYSSVSKASFQLQNNRNLAYAMNTSVFHLKMVDHLDEMLNETSDLSLYGFYSKLMEHQFQLCQEFPSQTRFICAFPQICTHFMNCLHQLCPEERTHIGEKGLSMCNLFLDEMAKEAKNIITNLCDQQCLLADELEEEFCDLMRFDRRKSYGFEMMSFLLQLFPKHLTRKIQEAMAIKKKRATEKGEKKGKQIHSEEHSSMPGDESHRKHREEMTIYDKLHIAMTELCFSINYYSKIVVWDHTFAPREYLIQHLENRFNKALVGMAGYDVENQYIAKPSELLSSVRAYMTVLQTVENYVHMDMTRVFNNVLLQQTQHLDCQGEDTITTLYMRWYLDVLLRRVSVSQILYSPHMHSFVNNSLATEGTAPQFSAQEYTDFTELRALSELISAYGVKFICERLVWHVASQISELKKLVIQNKEVLRAMRTSFDKPEKMRELFKSLTCSDSQRRNLDAVDNVLQRVIIIGEILAFKKLLQSALNDVLSERIPFILESIDDFRKNYPVDHPEQLCGIPVGNWEAGFEMCESAGVKVPVDAYLVNAIRAQMQSSEINADEDYLLCCLLVVFISVSLPKLARVDASFFKATFATHLNNAHCIALAINSLCGAMFTLHSRGDILERMKEFLALSSSCLLRLNDGRDEDKEVHKNKQSVYLLLDQVVEESPWLSTDLLESCFPYILLRSSYHFCYKQEDYSPPSQ